MGGAAGVDAPEPAARLRLLLQRAPAPAREDLGVTRSALSLVFGLATAGFTVSSVAAAFLYRLAPAPILIFASAVVAAGSAALAATANGLPQLLLGYGVVFGTGGGVGYILCQQCVNMLVRRRRGLVNGYIVVSTRWAR